MNARFPRCLALVLALLASGPGALAQSDPSEAMQVNICHLMQLSGSGDLAKQTMAQMIPAFQEAMPSVPDEFWERFMAKVDLDELSELIAPIYAKHFTHDEIKELIAFYQTPVGRKLVATLPAVMQESMVVGQQWGERLGARVVRELEAEGYQ